MKTNQIHVVVTRYSSVLQMKPTPSFGIEKLEWYGYHVSEKVRGLCSAILTQYRRYYVRLSH